MDDLVLVLEFKDAGHRSEDLLLGNTHIIGHVSQQGGTHEAALCQFAIRDTLAAVTNDMRVAQEEIFGPVACILKFRDEDEVIRMANDNAYGLGGAVWTRDLNRAIRVSRGIETGRMWVNTYNQIPEGSPFGGYKESGIGRETHKVILEHYTQMKNIMINLSEAPSGFYPAK